MVCELRRAHPRWGAQRIVHELMRGPVPPEGLPSRATVHRILVRHGLVVRGRGASERSEYVRWQRPAAMAALAAGHRLRADAGRRRTGELRQARIVTGVDDHSRYCVLARVVERATGRAICLAFSEALERYGAPEEVLTDNGKQFTGRFGRGGEVLFDKICRRNAITHRLTAPRSPTTTGKIERFHQTLRRELLDDARPFMSLLAAQAALDDWVREYNASARTRRWSSRAGHAGRALPARAGRAARAAAAVAAGAAGRGSRRRRRTRASSARSTPAPTPQPVAGRAGRVRSRRPGVGEPDGLQRQFWLGPARAGQTVRFWASVDVIHLTIAGARVKSLRSHFSTADLDQLAAAGRDTGGPAAAAAGRGRRGGRGRPRGQQQRPRRPRRQADPGRRDPRRPAR